MATNREITSLPLASTTYMSRPEYSLSEQARAVFEQYNSVGGIARGITKSLQRVIFSEDVADFNPYDGTHDIREGYETNYIDAETPYDVQLINEQIDRDLINQEIASTAPLPLALAAGVIDPINLLPMSWVNKGKTALSTAGRFAAAGAVTETAVEGILQSVQETRTLEESIANIGVATILSGALGASWKFMRDVDANFDMRDLVRRAEADISTPLSQSIGAAASRDLRLLRDDGTVDISLLGAADAARMERVFSFQDPVSRMLASPTIKTRELVAKLAEIPLTIKGAKEGKIAQEIPVENRVKGWDANRYVFTQKMNDAFVQYRKAQPEATGGSFTMFGYAVSDALKKPIKLTRAQFNEEVTRAARRGGTHAIPEVAKMAKSLRDDIFTPLAKEAMKVKKKNGESLLPEDFDLNQATDYVMRVWDQNVIKSRQKEFDDLNYTYLKQKRDDALSRIPEWEALLEKADVMLKDIKRDAKRAIGDARREITKSERKMLKVERDLFNAKQQTRKAENYFWEVTDRLERFTPDTVTKEESSYYNQLLKDLKRGGKKDAPVSLLGFIRRNGGIRDEEGKLALQGAAKITTGIINNKSGKNIDDLGELALGEGYYFERPDVNRILDDVLSELRGEIKVYRAQDESWFIDNDFISTLATEIDRAGISIYAIKDAAHLKKVLDNLPDANVNYRMATPAARARFRELKYQQQIAGRRLRVIDQVVIDLEEELIETAALVRNAKQMGRTIAEKVNDYYRKEIRGEQRSVKKIKEKLATDRFYAGFTDDDLQQITVELRNRILSLPAGRLDYEYKVGERSGKSMYNKTLPGTRGPLRGRAYDIPDLFEHNGVRLEEFLINDAEEIAGAYTRTMASQVEMVRTFGSLDLEDELADMRNEFEILKNANADNPKIVRKLQKAQQAAERDLFALRDRLLGTYEIPDDYAAWYSRGARVAKQFNYMRYLGGMTLSAIPDLARPVMVHGYTRVMRDGVGGFIKNKQAFMQAAKEIPEAGTALDIVLNTTARARADLDEFADTGHKIEGWMSRRSSEFSLLTLMPHWNAAAKQFSGVVSQSRMLRSIEDMISGKMLPENDKAYLLDNFIDDAMAQRIHNQFQRYGEITDDVYIPNARSWDDLEAQDVFRSAIRKTVDNIIVTPGIGKPLWMSKGIGPLVSQFKSFSFASMQRTMLSGLQQRDMAAFNGASLAIALGMMVYAVKAQETSDDPVKWIIEGVDRSGATGYLMEINNITEKFTRGRVGLNALTDAGVMSRYASRSVADSLLGPSLGIPINLAQVAGAIATGEMSESDIRAMRQLLIYQNHFAFKYMFDQMEAGLSNSFGVKTQ